MAYWTKACSKKNQTQDNLWLRALRDIGTPKVRGRKSFETLKDYFIRRSALVNVKAMWSCVPGQEKRRPSKKELDDLRDALNAWKSSSLAKEKDPQYFDRLLNGLRALCRGHLARDNIKSAKAVLEELENELGLRGWNQRTLPFADMSLLSAWIEGRKADNLRAKARLEWTEKLLRSMKDPLLLWFEKAVARKIM